VETQRQWSDNAIARTTPCLLGLFSLVTLLGKHLAPQTRRATAANAWYRKRQPTFSDTLAAVRRELWREQGFATSARTADMRKQRPALQRAITYASAVPHNGQSRAKSRWSYGGMSRRL